MGDKEFYEAPLLDQVLYDCTGMLVRNHPSIAEAMEKYHKSKLKKIPDSEIFDLIDDLSLDVMDYPDRSQGYDIPTDKPFVNKLINTVKKWIIKL